MQLKVIVSYFSVFVAFAHSLADFKDYKDYKIYSVYSRSKDQLKLIKLLSTNPSYNFLIFSRRNGEPSRVLVSPQDAIAFVKYLHDYSLNYTVLTNDLSVEIMEQRAETSMRPRSDLRLKVFENYYKHFEINEHLDLLASLFPMRAHVKNFGDSYEKRPLKFIRITNGDGRRNKKLIFINAGMHAHEWIATSLTLYIIDQLLDNYTENADLLQDFDWVIIPVVNADGYEYTHSDDRFWRKTRKPNIGSDCVGTDLNRNFNFAWDKDIDGSKKACDENFQGDKAFSEPEASAMADLMRSYSERIQMYLSLHAYGNVILLPYGHSADLPDNYDDMMDVVDVGVMAVVQETGTMYNYGNRYSMAYPTSGDPVDYAAGAMNIPVSLAMHLPAGGVSGFNPPVRKIYDIVSEAWVIIQAMSRELVENY